MFLNNFEIIKPKNKVAQKHILDWIIRTHVKAEKLKLGLLETSDEIELIKKLFNRYAVKDNQISARYLECDDILNSDENSYEIYNINEQDHYGSDITKKTHFFLKRALSVFGKIYNQKSVGDLPDHIIHVTCTGYISPSAPQIMVATKAWQKSTAITHAYHMGCYAAMPAVRMAESFVYFESQKNSDFKLDIVHNEMCGLHMNPLAQTPEQIIVQTLFADGHVKYSATNNKIITANNKPANLKVHAVLEKVITDSEQDMSWVPAPWGMQMNLSRQVPVKIKAELKIFFQDLLLKAGLSNADADQAVFAVHPGGPKIIDAVQEVLQLSEDQVKHSKKILSERGNMSSATLPHVWSEILEANYPAGTNVISFAFGPGLTLFGSVFEVC